MARELTVESVVGLAARMTRREASPVEVVEACLRRIERERLNAVVTLAEDAIEQAQSAERALMKGDVVGPLCGVPVTVKETIDARGLRATAGSAVRATRVALADAPAVARLRQAGAVILGKTNCAELALDYTTDNPIFGRTVNPHDSARTPGGSSGGCAAAVAARLTYASLGSDLVGSIRVPAHFCGVVGFRPAGRDVPREGHTPPVLGAYTLGASLGPLTRRVADARLLYEVLSGGYEKSSGGAANWSGIGVGQEGESDNIERLRGVRFARYGDKGSVPVAKEVRDVVTAAARVLEEVGMLSGDEPPHVESCSELWLTLISPATTLFLCEEFAGREGEAGPSASALMRRGAADRPPSVGEYVAAWERRDRMRAELLKWMERTPLLLAPIGAVPAFRHEEARRIEVAGRGFNTFRAFSQAQVCNLFDLPAISVPAGRTTDGLPIGVQLATQPGEETLLFAAAAAVERALGGWQAPSDKAPQPGANPL